jgi:uncharacterized protein YvpB
LLVIYFDVEYVYVFDNLKQHVRKIEKHRFDDLCESLN